MLRRLLAVIPLALLTACIIPPGDREQIEALIRSRESNSRGATLRIGGVRSGRSFGAASHK